MSANKVEYLICPRLKHFKSLPKATQALKDGNNYTQRYVTKLSGIFLDKFKYFE